MVTLTVDDIILVHSIVVDRFKISSGVINKGVLDAAAKRPGLQTKDKKFIYKDPFSRAASILEAIIRWHPFADGNKRTALLTTIMYLGWEGYGVALPLSAVRYTVEIAKNMDNSTESTEQLIKEIKWWLKNHSGRTREEIRPKLFIYVLLPYRFYQFLAKIGFKKYVERKISEWMAFDIYPEYKKEADTIISFINEALQASMTLFDVSLEKKQEIILAKHHVSIPRGTSSPGCEEHHGCFIPHELKIKSGEPVEWTNDDAAAHTITSGTVANGHDGIFNSSLVMSGKSFIFSFKDAKPGKYPYYCMVHPWQIGIIIVEK